MGFQFQVTGKFWNTSKEQVQNTMRETGDTEIRSSPLHDTLVLDSKSTALVFSGYSYLL